MDEFAEKRVKYWFTIGLRHEGLLDRDDVVKKLEKEFYIKCQGYGTGKHKEKQADFYVCSKEKRSEIQKYVRENVGCKFYFYVVK